jgi:hypothetical protein
MARAKRVDSIRLSQRKPHMSNREHDRLHRAVVANVWSNQQAADRALQRYQMARKAGYSIDYAVEFAFEGLGSNVSAVFRPRL